MVLICSVKPHHTPFLQTGLIGSKDNINIYADMAKDLAHGLSNP
jgi:hypothetical protein